MRGAASRLIQWTLLGLMSAGGVFALVELAGPASAETQADAQRSELQRQIEALEREAAELDGKISDAQAEAKTLQQQIRVFDSEIRRRELEAQRLGLAIRQAEIDIQVKTNAMELLAARIAKNRAILGESILKIDGYDRENVLLVLMKHDTLSEFFSALDNIRDLQTQLDRLLAEMRENRVLLEEEKAELEQFHAEQLELRALSEIAKRGAQSKRTEKDQLLRVTRGREASFQQLLTQKKQDIAALRTKLFYLERTGISAEDALHFAKLAAERTGIRTAFLLGILEVETGRQFEGGVISAGTYLGTGNWKTDMYDCYVSLGRQSVAEQQKAAFFAIAASLGMDPDDLPVSRRPSYGCGGAMGPAQFIATTWLLFSDRVAAMTGHSSPSPWNIEDAFTASALFLADSGATTKAKDGEIRAARTYISGRPNCPASGASRSACIAYANRVYELSLEIDAVID